MRRILSLLRRKKGKSHAQTPTSPELRPAVLSPPAQLGFPTPNIWPTATAVPNEQAHQNPLARPPSKPDTGPSPSSDGVQNPVTKPSNVLPPTSAVPPQTDGDSDGASESNQKLIPGTSPTKAPDPSVADDTQLQATVQVIHASVINKPQDISKVEQTLNTLDDKVAAVQALIGGGALFSSIEAAANLNVPSGVKTKMEEGFPLLIDVLNEVAKIHPFIGVAVTAFKAVYTLELKRRENEKKVVALYLQMKEMIAVLLDLKDIRDPSNKGPGGEIIQGRLPSLVDRTARDIMDCANVCDVYCKMTLLAKVIRGPIWDGKFANFATTFTTRQAEFKFALSIHSSRGIEEANHKLDNVMAELKKSEARLKGLIECLVWPNQMKLAGDVAKKGGPESIIASESILRELLAGESTGSLTMMGEDPSKDGLDRLKMELSTDPAVAIKMNMEAFEGKLAIQQREIVKEIKRESDRVIQLVTSGPHERVVDKDLYTIWKDMGWRGSVRAHDFVLALRDYYYDRTHEQQRREKTFNIAPVVDQDAWTLGFLDVKLLQRIAEAFDEDASGFVTVAEANALTAARPLDWSLSHWLAYWSVGWQIAAWHYVERIDVILLKMAQLMEKMNPRNIQYVNQYFAQVRIGLAQLALPMMVTVSGLVGLKELAQKFESYNSAEEERIKKNLENIHFNINDLHTLTLVTGPGRIERYLFPLLYLLLQRDLEIFRIARSEVLNRDELWDSAWSIRWIFCATEIRFRQLSDAFTQQKLDLGQQFKTVYSGLYYYVYSSTLFEKMVWRTKRPLAVDFEDKGVQDEQKATPQAVLRYPLDRSDVLDYGAYNLAPFTESEDDKKIERGILRKLIGRWYCVTGTHDNPDWPIQPMDFRDMHVSPDGQRLEGMGYAADGSAYGLIWTIETEKEQTTIVMTPTLAAQFRTTAGRVILADSDDVSETIAATFGHPHTIGTFILSRLPPEILVHRPSPKEFEANRIQALWQFAISAVRDQVRRRMWSWSHFKSRGEVRRRYIDLLLGNRRHLDKEVAAEYSRCCKALSPADARLYHTIRQHQLQTASVHDESCNACGAVIYGTRVVCLACNEARPVDFCDDERCLAVTVSTIHRTDLTTPHMPSHPMYKIRKRVTLRHFAWLDEEARAALERARTVLKDAGEIETDLERRKAVIVGVGDNTVPAGNHKIACTVCRTPVSLPCWYCISCSDHIFICLTCDPRDGIDVGRHEKTHPIVRIQTEEVKPATMEDRMKAIEGKFSMLDAKVARVDDRLSRMEGLLCQMLDHFGVTQHQGSHATNPTLEGPQTTQLDGERYAGQEMTQSQ